MEKFRQIQIIEHKIEVYENSLYDAGLDARIGKTLEDDSMVENAKTNMKRINKALDVLKDQLKELKNDETQSSS